MSTNTETTTRYAIRHRWTDAVLFECDIPEGLDSGLHARHALEQAVLARASLDGASLVGARLARASLDGANLDGASLDGARLDGASLDLIRADLYDILLRAPAEVPALRLALAEGRVDGSVYTGECACLVGTIAKARGVSRYSLCGIEPNASRPAERWFLGIGPGDTADSNQVVAITLGWIDEFSALLDAAALLRAPGAAGAQS